MRLSELQTALRRYGFDESDPLTTWLNAALHEFEDEFVWPWLDARVELTLRPGQNVLEMPEDFRKIRSVRSSATREKLRYFDEHRFERIVEEPTQEGSPVAYTVSGMEMIRVWPIPPEEVTYHVLYIRRVSDLVNAEDVPGIPVQYHYAIVRGAAWIALQAENEEDRAQVAERAWQADLLRAKSYYSSREEDELHTVEDVQQYGEA